MPYRKMTHPIVLIAATLTTVCVVILPLWKQYEQQQLNRQLFTAIRSNNNNAVVALLNAGANASANDTGWTVSFRQFVLLKMSGGSLPQRPSAPSALSVAIARALHDNTRGPYPIIHALLEHHADANGKYTGESEEAGTMTDSEPLFIMAANMEDMSCLNDLAVHGAKVDVLDAQGLTALMYAAADRRIATVKCLLALGANARVKGPTGSSALDFAQQHYGSLNGGKEDEEDKRARRETIHLLERGTN